MNIQGDTERCDNTTTVHADTDLELFDKLILLCVINMIVLYLYSPVYFSVTFSASSKYWAGAA